MNLKKGISIFLLICVLSASGFLPAAAAPLAAPPIPLNIHFQTVVTGLSQPVFATNAGDGSGRLFIVQQGGQIIIFKNGALLALPFLDISSLLVRDGGEQGLLGLAFAPDYSTSGVFYVSYTAPSPITPATTPYAITLARYKVSSNPDIADPNSGQVLLSVPKIYTNHNGSMLAFGPDHFLYMSTGDGGNGGDPNNNAQNQKSLLGKLLRIAVNSTGSYTIPSTNPYFSNTSGFRKEIWSYGLRNAWRFSFDRSNGDLYIGDVGQNTEEEIDFQTHGANGGQNYGWRIKEGNLCFNPVNCTPPPNYVAPIAVYDHGTNDSVGCAVTGGYVYRGTTFPELKGAYLYGDFCTGRLWGLVRNANSQWTSTPIADTNYSISAFAEDENGELYIVDYSGQLIHIARAAITVVNFVSSAAQDGYVVESAENSNAGGTLNSNAGFFDVGDNALNRQLRGIMSFPTSSLPDTAVIVSARLKLTRLGLAGINPFSTHGGLIIDVRKPFFGTAPTLDLDDFAAAASLTAGGSVANTPAGAVYTGTFSPAALSAFNRTGLTQLRLRFQLDDNNNSIADYLAFYSADASNAALKPTLEITYFVP
jgi:glucose/arabinose dehydrogenase